MVLGVELQKTVTQLREPRGIGLEDVAPLPDDSGLPEDEQGPRIDGAAGEDDVTQIAEVVREGMGWAEIP